jgi:hypothetical protein
MIPRNESLLQNIYYICWTEHSVSGLSKLDLCQEVLAHYSTILGFSLLFFSYNPVPNFGISRLSINLGNLKAGYTCYFMNRMPHCLGNLEINVSLEHHTYPILSQQLLHLLRQIFNANPMVLFSLETGGNWWRYFTNTQEGLKSIKIHCIWKTIHSHPKFCKQL